MQLTSEELKRIISELKTSRIFTIEDQKKDLIKRLSTIRRNVLVSGGIISLFILAEIKIEGVSTGLIRGTISHPEIVPVFLSLVFLYYFFLFINHLKKLEKELSLIESVRTQFYNRVAQNVVNSEIRSILNSNSDIANLEDDQIYSAVQSIKDKTSNSSLEVRTLEVNISPGIKEAFGQVILESNSNFSSTGNADHLNFHYDISEDDKAMLEKSIGFMKQMNTINLMDYNFPKLFGWIAIGIIVLRIIFPVAIQFISSLPGMWPI